MSILTQSEKELCWALKLKRLNQAEDAWVMNAPKFTPIALEGNDPAPYPDKLLCPPIHWKQVCNFKMSGNCEDLNEYYKGDNLIEFKALYIYGKPKRFYKKFKYKRRFYNAHY